MAKLGPYELNSIVTGDARELAKDIPDESVDLILTDPPFGISFKYSNGYNDNPDDYEDLIRWLVDECNRIIRPGGLSFVYVAHLRLRDIWPLFPKDSRIFAATKNFTQYQPTAVQYGYDAVLFWQKQGEPLISPMAVGRDWHTGNTAYYVTQATFHSCPRPLDTIMYIVDKFSHQGGIIIDFFMGSGTTALASKMTGRSFWGCEIDPETADLARQRVANTQPPLPLVYPEQLAMEV